MVFLIPLLTLICSQGQKPLLIGIFTLSNNLFSQFLIYAPELRKAKQCHLGINKYQNNILKILNLD